MTRVRKEGKNYYVIHCDGEPKDKPHESCPNTVVEIASAKIHAQQGGWYFSRNNRIAYCPDCLPEWVIKWREKRNEMGS